MSLDQVTAQLRARVGENCGINHSLKINLGDDGFIHIDGSVVPNQVTNDDSPADATLSLTLRNFEAIQAGDLNPQMAFMTGKIKLAGSMDIAMRFAQLLRAGD